MCFGIPDRLSGDHRILNGLQTLATDSQAGGNTDVMFMTSNHIVPSRISEATQATYVAAIRAAAANTSNSSYGPTGVPVADEFELSYVECQFSEV
jgi:hypothetical protein